MFWLINLSKEFNLLSIYFNLRSIYFNLFLIYFQVISIYFGCWFVISWVLIRNFENSKGMELRKGFVFFFTPKSWCSQ